MLAAVALKAGDRVDLIAADAVPRALLQRANLATLSQTMTGLEPALLEADAAGLVGQILQLARRRCLVVLFTDLTAATIEEGLLPALEPLQRRHEVMVAAVADPLVAELVSARGSPEAVYSAAAAERASPSGAGSPRSCAGAGSRWWMFRRPISRAPSRITTSP